MDNRKDTAVYVVLGLAIGVVLTYLYLTPQIENLNDDLQFNIQKNTELTSQYNELHEGYTFIFEHNETLTDNYNTLVDNHDNLTNQFNNLSQDHSTISIQINTLTTDYQNLQDNFNYISSAHDSLSSSHDLLSNNYETVTGDFIDVSIDMDELFELLDQYSKLPDSFERVLNMDEVEKTASLVTSITNPSDTWYSLERIYKHITNLVDYAEDVNFPYCYNIQYEYVNENKVITDFQVATVREFIQTPSFTLEYTQGDGDDQAILEYAMINYYEKEIHGTDYTTYLAAIEFGDGNGHLAVIVPAVDDNICILDPAGSYFTSISNRITSRSVSYELTQYANRWASNDGISNIRLYEVDIADGSYDMAVSGTLDELIMFFENSL
jgi:hypothetical protein